MKMIRLLGVVAAMSAFTVGAADGEAEYDRRNAERYVALFTVLDRNTDGVVTREEAQGDLNFGPRFNDMDINRDGVVTAEELHRFVLLEHGVSIVLK